MRRRVAIVYNEPIPSRYDRTSEQKAVEGVMESVSAVRQSLVELNDVVTVFPLVPPFKEARRKLAALNVDIVFNLFEGFCGEPETEALVPETLDDLGIDFTGCRADVLRLALDKAKIKVIFKNSGIPTPDFQLLNPETLGTFRLGFPCIVKPRGEDASHGISEQSVVSDIPALEKQVRFVSEAYNSGALVEEFIGGREFNATVIGNRRTIVLPVSEIIYSLPPDVPRVLTYAAKWEDDSAYFKGTQVACPADVTFEEREHIAGAAQSAYALAGCSGYARVDMRMDESGKLNIIEINPNPDISPSAGAARQSRAAGMSYARFIDTIINMALEKNKNDRQNTPAVGRGQTVSDADAAAHSRI